MSLAASTSSVLRTVKSHHACALNLIRAVSSSPYGRTHVWRRRAPKLPPPLVPHFPQRVILADGSTYVHWTTSPRSTLRLTRDATNNPLWNPRLEAGNSEELEGRTSGRLGRFRRRFEELGGTEMETELVEEESSQRAVKDAKAQSLAK